MQSAPRLHSIPRLPSSFHLINRVGRYLVGLGGFVEDAIGAAIVKLD